MGPPLGDDLSPQDCWGVPQHGPLSPVLGVQPPAARGHQLRAGSLVPPLSPDLGPGTTLACPVSWRPLLWEAVLQAGVWEGPAFRPRPPRPGQRGPRWTQSAENSRTTGQGRAGRLQQRGRARAGRGRAGWNPVVCYPPASPDPPLCTDPTPEVSSLSHQGSPGPTGEPGPSGPPGKRVNAAASPSPPASSCMKPAPPSRPRPTPRRSKRHDQRGACLTRVPHTACRPVIASQTRGVDAPAPFKRHQVLTPPSRPPWEKNLLPQPPGPGLLHSPQELPGVSAHRGR